MNKHRMDLASLVFGILFSAGGALLLVEGFEIGDFNLGLLWPGMLVLIGLAILLATRSPEKPISEPHVQLKTEATLPLPKSDS